MPKLIIKDRLGKKSEIEYDSNFTLMETLRDNGYDIEASCGGCCVSKNVFLIRKAILKYFLSH